MNRGDKISLSLLARYKSIWPIVHIIAMGNWSGQCPDWSLILLEILHYSAYPISCFLHSKTNVYEFNWIVSINSIFNSIQWLSLLIPYFFQISALGPCSRGHYSKCITIQRGSLHCALSLYKVWYCYVGVYIRTGTTLYYQGKVFFHTVASRFPYFVDHKSISYACWKILCPGIWREIGRTI